jgi:hypothetical protein
VSLLCSDIWSPDLTRNIREVPTPALRVHVMVCVEPGTLAVVADALEQVYASGMAAVPYVTSSAPAEIYVASNQTDTGDDPDTAYVDGTDSEAEPAPEDDSLNVEAVMVGPANETRFAEPVWPAKVTDTGRLKPPIDDAANVQVSLVCAVTMEMLAHATLPTATDVSDVDAPKPVPVIVMTSPPFTEQSVAAIPADVQPAILVTTGG